MWATCRSQASSGRLQANVTKGIAPALGLSLATQQIELFETSRRALEEVAGTQDFQRRSSATTRDKAQTPLTRSLSTSPEVRQCHRIVDVLLEGQCAGVVLVDIDEELVQFAGIQLAMEIRADLLSVDEAVLVHVEFKEILLPLGSLLLARRGIAGCNKNNDRKCGTTAPAATGAMPRKRRASLASAAPNRIVAMARNSDCAEVGGRLDGLP
eukprot:CAMPEP_0170251664 /NCGR_PEP_ID=MMETSP0116_2-20130129/25662_1 /TAXON_ID=400756 /ORGANISM="Durinskia baltica, Strain CSIRO CS-38" /LENGTH=211 /DNA_ID=CAMNT_0010502627 /DNA_START=73 /DNA_END=707 /DNA_ORIENTATION=-